MKSLVVSCGNFELTRSVLNKSSILIGRLPTCDLVVRAPGIQPIHFLVEWVGVGEFNAKLDNWIVFDISHAPSYDYSTEGILLQTAKKAELGNFVFSLEQAALTEANHRDGAVKKSTAAFTSTSDTPIDRKLVEVVWIRSDSGAIEDVSHFVPAKIAKKTLAVKQFPDFKVQMHPSNVNLKLFFEYSKDFKVFSKGKLLETGQEELSLNDFLQVHWKTNCFLLRFVNKISSPPIRRARVDGLFIKISLASAALFTFLLLPTLVPVTPKRESPDARASAPIAAKDRIDKPSKKAPLSTIPAK